MPAINAHGSTFTFDSVAVDGLTSIGLPDQSKEEVEITHHGSAGWREFLPGLRDGGTVTLGGRVIPGDAGQAALDANFNADNVVVEVVITSAPDSAGNAKQYTFNAYVSQTGGALPYDAAAEASWTLRIDGEVTPAVVSA